MIFALLNNFAPTNLAYCQCFKSTVPTEEEKVSALFSETPGRYTHLNLSPVGTSQRRFIIALLIPLSVEGIFRRLSIKSPMCRA